MACLGVHFAIAQDVADQLVMARDDAAVMHIVEGLEDAWVETNLAESDKAWEAIHRVLTDGNLEFGNGDYPLSHCILGPRQLYKCDDYIISLALAAEVRDIAAVLNNVTEEWFGNRYWSVVPSDYSPNYGQEDLEYSWGYFKGICSFFHAAAENGLAAIFTVDQ